MLKKFGPVQKETGGTLSLSDGPKLESKALLRERLGVPTWCDRK